MTPALIGLAFGAAYALVNVTRMIPPYSMGELLIYGPPGPYPDGDRLPPPEDDQP
jgi:hypothetical protein